MELKDFYMLTNYTTIKAFVLVSIIILTSAALQNKAPFSSINFHSSKSPFYQKSKLISKFITAFSFLAYAIYLSQSINLEKRVNWAPISVIFIFLYHFYIWLITRIFEAKNQ